MQLYSIVTQQKPWFLGNALIQYLATNLYACLSGTVDKYATVFHVGPRCCIYSTYAQVDWNANFKNDFATEQNLFCWTKL